MYINDDGSVGGGCSLVNATFAQFAVRPTFYLKPTVAITSDDGTSSSPYYLVF